MSNTVQDFLAASIQKTALDVTAALLRLPVDRRVWAPAETSRTAMDIFAECAMNNGITANVIEARKWVGEPFEVYLQKKVDLAAQGLETIEAQLRENTDRLIAVIKSVPDDALEVTIETPYGAGPLRDIMAYPYWNMAYHEGQINYIASMLALI